MLAEPDRTPYDLNFRLFGFRVRIHPLFWLGSALLGAGFLNAGDGRGLLYMAIWILVVLVSILVHELGHAIAFRRFGSDSHIVLWMFGGLAVPYSGVAGRGRRILVSLAGPFAGFLLCGLVYGTDKATDWGDRLNNGALVAFLCSTLIMVNLFWGIFNLLPVFPLDGGQVTKELCEGKWHGRGLIVALKISVGVAAAVAICSLLSWIESKNPRGALDFLPLWFPRPGIFTAILFAMLAVQNYQLLQQLGGRGGGYYYEAPDDRVPWEK